MFKCFINLYWVNHIDAILALKVSNSPLCLLLFDAPCKKPPWFLPLIVSLSEPHHICCSFVRCYLIVLGCKL